MSPFSIGDIVYDLIRDISFDTFRLIGIKEERCELYCIEAGGYGADQYDTIYLSIREITKDRRKSLLKKISVCEDNLDKYCDGEGGDCDETEETYEVALDKLRRKLKHGPKLKRKAI